ncbi:probable E3 ubiquitin-protein ligase bre1 [Melitaea cinxia]|uniref:probable E3 ubiquitin-protein ligase bre1 n=1 Tax=Melitaea cinxia TaxID=113334 RepID=UPI001E2709BD|nr:probable E3 ubiquitin-protein ligase bre1 [Melitaea cinxia]
MEDMTKILKSIQIDLAEQKTEMKEMEANITKNITKAINDNFKTIELKYNQLNKQLQIQENILDRIERHNRKKNLVFFGIEEGEKTYQELEKDYPPKVLEKRKQLQSEILKYKAEGKKAIIKYDKLIVLHQYKPNDNQQPSKKRNLHNISPNHNNNNNMNQVSKKNKTEITAFMQPKKSFEKNQNTMNINNRNSTSST